MIKFVFVLVFILAVFSLFLLWIDSSNWSTGVFSGAVITMVIITIAAHFLLPGKMSLATLPLGWALCLIPAYIYSYYLTRAGFLGHSATFTIVAFCLILPTGAVALILSIIGLIRSCMHK